MGIKLKTIMLLQIVAILLIIGSISLLYSPALKHLPRSDQLTYLVNTIDSHTTWETFKNSYSYNRTRIIYASDTGLFRPLLFLILSLERGLFGNFSPWIQAIGIFLHIVVVLLLFIILNQLRGIFKIKVYPKKDFAFTTLGISFISFYAFNFSFTEIIVWQHLHGYMVFHIFTLLSFILILKYISIYEKHNQRKWTVLVPIWFLIFLSAFAFELGQIYALLVGIFFFILLKKNKLKEAISVSLLFFAIPAIYQFINIIDLRIHEGHYQTDITALMIIKRAFGVQTVEHSLQILRYWVVHPFFPSLAKISHTARAHIADLNFNQIGLLTLPSFLAFASWILFTFLGVNEFMKRNFQKLGYFLILLLFLYLGYFALIVLGRLNIYPERVIIPTNTYYLYFPICYMIVFTLVLIGAVVLNDRLINNKFVRYAKYSLFLSIPIVICSSILNINKINAGFSNRSREFIQIVDKVQEFLNQHPISTISFSLDHSAGVPPRVHGVHITTVLFHKYEDNRTPDFVVTLAPGRVNFIPVNEYRAIYNLKESDEIAPTLVKVGFPQQIYEFNGKYFALTYYRESKK